MSGIGMNLTMNRYNPNFNAKRPYRLFFYNPTRFDVVVTFGRKGFSLIRSKTRACILTRQRDVMFCISTLHGCYDFEHVVYGAYSGYVNGCSVRMVDGQIRERSYTIGPGTCSRILGFWCHSRIGVMVLEVRIRFG